MHEPWTRRSLAAFYNVSPEKIGYVIKSRGLLPVVRIGNTRVFGNETVQRIGRELRLIRARRKN